MASKVNSIKLLENRKHLPVIKFPKKISEEGTLPNSFHKATITLIPKPDKKNTPPTKKKRKRERKL